MANVQVQEMIGDFLLSDIAIGQIDFSIGLAQRIKVDTMRLRYVGELVKSGVMEILLMDPKEMQDACNKPCGGKYTETNKLMLDKNQIQLDWNGSNYKGKMWIRAVVVHEATHAVIDLNRRSVFSHREEAAAYLATCIFLHYHGALGLFIGSDIFNEAGNVVKNHQLNQKQGVHLSRNNISALLRAIRKHPTYSYSPFKRSLSNGFDNPYLLYGQSDPFR